MSRFRPDSASGSRRAEQLVTRILDDRAEGLEPDLAELCDGDECLIEEVTTSLEIIERLGLDEARPIRPLERLGPYALGERLGGGGMGVVYLATDDEGREVALKVVRPDLALFENSHKRFRREVEVVSRLDHSGVVPILDVGEDGGVAYLVMPRIKGCTLQQLLDEVHPCPAKELTGDDWRHALSQVCGTRVAGWPGESWYEPCLELGRQVARALAHAHTRGVFHRDIKPSNIMVTPGGAALLLDFGLAHAEGASPLTRTGALLGSEAYLAPEQVRGTVGADVSTDVYSLGVTLYQALALRLPFDGGGSPQLLRQRVMAGNATTLDVYVPTLPPDVVTLCQVAMDLDPHRRPVDAAAFAADVERQQAGEPVLARPPGLSVKAARWVRANPVLFTGLAAVLVLVAGSVAFGIRERNFAEASAIQANRTAYANRKHAEAASVRWYWTQLERQERGEIPARHDLRTRLGLRRIWPIDLDTTSPGRQVQVLVQQAACLMSLGQFEQANEILWDAKDLCEAGASADLGDVYLRLGRLNRERENRKASARFLDDALDELLRQPIVDEVAVAEVLHEQVLTAASRDMDVAAAAYLQALDQIESRRELFGDPSSELAESYILLSDMEIKRGDPTVAWIWLEAARTQIESVALPPWDDLPGQYYLARARVATVLGLPAEAEQFGRLAMSEAEAAGHTGPDYADALLWVVNSLRVQGRFEEALDLLQDCLGLRRTYLTRSTDALNWRTMGLLIDQAMMSLATGRLAAAAHALEEVAEELPSRVQATLLWHTIATASHRAGFHELAGLAYAWAMTHATQGRAEETEWDGKAGTVLSHDDPLGYLRAWVQLNYSVVLCDQGQQAEADRVAAEALDLLREHYLEPARVAEDDVSRLMRRSVLGECLLVGRQPTEAVEVLQAVVDGYEELGGVSALWRAQADAWLGEGLLALGRDDEAIEVLDRALAAFGSLVTPQQPDRARTTRLLYEARSANGMSTSGLAPGRMHAGPRILSYRAVY